MSAAPFVGDPFLFSHYVTLAVPLGRYVPQLSWSQILSKLLLLQHLPGWMVSTTPHQSTVRLRLSTSLLAASAIRSSIQPGQGWSLNCNFQHWFTSVLSHKATHTYTHHRGGLKLKAYIIHHLLAPRTNPQSQTSTSFTKWSVLAACSQT